MQLEEKGLAPCPGDNTVSGPSYYINPQWLDIYSTASRTGATMRPPSEFYKKLKNHLAEYIRIV